jgi:hypothetical protein
MGLDDQFRPSKRNSGAVGHDGFDYHSTQHGEAKRRRDCYYLPHRSCEHLDRLPAVRLFVINQAMEPLTTNKSPEPTAVGAVRSAVAVNVTNRRWLIFFR